MTFDIQEIMGLLPHRYPFLLLDRIIEFEPAKRLVAIKNVTINEPFFQGHFPGYPIMPGVLVVEAMAQAGAIIAEAQATAGLELAQARTSGAAVLEALAREMLERAVGPEAVSR